jgi:predicted lactoylglutathione lyase
MKLGAFSVSLNVKDIRASKTFYEKLGFEEFGGNIEMNYLIMKNGESVIGLFQGMFESNILTFNPGWDQSANTLKDYADIREIQAKLKETGVSFMSEVESESGPGSAMLTDPDGNVILLDQHVG